MNLVGKTLGGRYEILEEIGEGGMAVVYKARCKVLNRFVAVKVLRPDLKDNKEFIQRFRIEAQAAASLTHPNIVSIYDVGCDGDYNYIIMEYIEGETLREYMDRNGKQLSWRESVGFAMQIAMGLEQAHKNSIVHRDIKPQNILMTADKTLKVTDFGIARANVDETMTYKSSAIGTVHYVSPEQARGGYTDERSDIYSLGIMLYEMLTGVVPFDHESPVTIAIKHLQEPPTPVRELCISVPMSVERIVMKMIDKDANLRPKNAAELIKVFSAILENPAVNISEDNENSAVDNSRTIMMPKIDRRVIERNSEEIKEERPDMRRTKRDYDAQIDKKKEKKVITAAVITAVVIIIGLSAAAFSLLGLGGLFGGGQSRDIEIPDLIGMTFEDAKAKYKDTQFSIIKVEEVESTEKEGTIVEQDPKAGESVKNKENITVNVSVSQGVSEIKLKDYTKYKDVREAELEIEELGLVVDIIEEYSDTVPEKAIIRQSPKESSSVKKNDVVTLYVSKGPREETKATEKPKEEEKKDNNKTNNSTNSESGNSSGTSTGSSGNSNSQSGKGQSGSSSSTSSQDKKKSTMLTVYGPKNSETAYVEVRVNGKSVYGKQIKKGESDVVKLEGNTSQVDVEILYDGVSSQKKTVTLY